MGIPGASSKTAGQTSGARLALPILLCAALAVVLRDARGYRPFPSIDDFTYAPLAWLSGDPTLFPRDTLLRAYPGYAPAWNLILEAARRTTGVSLGLWLITLFLSVATVGAVARLLRSANVSLWLLPLCVVVAFGGTVSGFGRGAYDGAFGDAFHVQWLAICFLLWAYDAFIREQPVRAGLLLGLAALSHPLVGFHGAVALLVATVLSSKGRWARLAMTGVIAFLVSLPLVASLGPSLLHHSGTSSDWTTERIIREGYIFRAPHHYALGALPPQTAWYFVAMVLGGVAATLLLRHDGAWERIRGIAGLLLGQSVPAAGAAALHGPWLEGAWKYRSVVPYLLDLTRTSGLLLPLAAVLIVTAIDRRPALRRSAPFRREILWLGLLGVLVTALLFFVRWQAVTLAVVVAGVAARIAGRHRFVRATAGVAIGLTAVAGLVLLAREVRDAPVGADEASLYSWVRSSPREALYIVPPGMQEFRYYARRSVFVDFKSFPPSTPGIVPLWRHRLEEIAAPDRQALEADGWDGVALWDRSYANRNTPSRVADLLKSTGADYFVWDRSGLDVPPYVPLGRPDDSRVERVFHNERFEVFRLGNRVDGRSSR